jgi:hypothetical protein
MALHMMRTNSKFEGSDIQIRWSSIFSGAITTLGFGLVFLLFGNAIGLSLSNAVSTTVGGALEFWSWLYTAVVLITSYYLGSFVSTRTSEITHQAAGGFQGMVSWSFATFLSAIFIELAAPAGNNNVLQGTTSDSANWLALCVVAVGLGASVIGGRNGKNAIPYILSEEKREEVEKAA